MKKVINIRVSTVENGFLVNEIESSLEMQLHKFDVGCPRCGCDFADFTCVIEDS